MNTLVGARCRRLISFTELAHTIKEEATGKTRHFSRSDLDVNTTLKSIKPMSFPFLMHGIIC